MIFNVKFTALKFTIVFNNCNYLFMFLKLWNILSNYVLIIITESTFAAL